MRSQNKLRHHSAVTREDFCCDFCVLVFGRGLGLALAFSTVARSADAEGSGVASAGLPAGVLSIGHGVASLMRLAIV